MWRDRRLGATPKPGYPDPTAPPSDAGVTALGLELSRSDVDNEVVHDQSAEAQRRRLLLVLLGAAALLGSWLVAWVLPAPRLCKSISCGENFNPDQVPHPLSFWTWPQLVVVLLGLVFFATLIVLALRQSRAKPGQ
jgi:hypothetical protein